MHGVCCFCLILTKIELFRKILVNVQLIKFHRNPSCAGRAQLHSDKWTDMTRLPLLFTANFKSPRIKRELRTGRNAEFSFQKWLTKNHKEHTRRHVQLLAVVLVVWQQHVGYVTTRTSCCVVEVSDRQRGQMSGSAVGCTTGKHTLYCFSTAG